MTTLEHMNRKVKAIDRDLSVVWLAHEGKYAVVQVLANTPSIEEMTRRVARELQQTALAAGYQLALPECELLAYTKVAEQQIVLRVEHEDGTPMDLDERTLTRLREMAWTRRHFRLEDYIAAAETMTYEAQQQRQRKIDSIWGSIRRDPVFKRCLSDALWGNKPTRSVGGPLPATAA